MTEFALSLKIEKVGDLEALNALNALDKKGREIVENVAGATGRSLSSVALAYERGSKSARLSLEAIATEHEKNIRVMQREAQQADRLGERQARSTASAARGLEVLGRTGALTGRSLDAVARSVSELAFGFGTAGPLVGAIAIGTAAMVEMFARVRREAKKAADDMAKEFSRIAHLDVVGQSQEATKLYSGDKYAADPLDRFGIKGLTEQKAALEARLKRGTTTFYGAHGIATTQMTADANDAYDVLQKVKAKLDQIVPIYQSIVGPGGSLADAAARLVASDQPGFITDQIKQAESAGKKAAQEFKKAWNAEVKEFAKGVDERGNALQTKAQQMAAQMTENHALTSGAIFKELIPDPKKAMQGDKFDLGLHITEAIKNDPFLTAKREFDKAVKALATHMHEELSRTLGQGIGAAFEAAFTGGGITGAFKALTATVLAGFGGFMEQLGAQMIVVGLALDALATSLRSLNGPGAIAAGIALVAAGAGLKAIAGSFGGGSHGGSGGYSSGSGLASIIDRGIINPDSYSDRQASTIQTRPSVTNNTTIIGPNDPSAQRAWDELQRKSLQRGSLAGAAA